MESGSASCHFARWARHSVAWVLVACRHSDMLRMEVLAHRQRGEHHTAAALEARLDEWEAKGSATALSSDPLARRVKVAGWQSGRKDTVGVVVVSVVVDVVVAARSPYPRSPFSFAPEGEKQQRQRQ